MASSISVFITSGRNGVITFKPRQVTFMPRQVTFKPPFRKVNLKPQMRKVIFKPYLQGIKPAGAYGFGFGPMEKKPEEEEEKKPEEKKPEEEEEKKPKEEETPEKKLKREWDEMLEIAANGVTVVAGVIEILTFIWGLTTKGRR